MGSKEQREMRETRGGAVEQPTQLSTCLTHENLDRTESRNK